MKSLFFLLMINTLSLVGYSQDYTPIKVNGLFGFSKNGALVIPATFQYVTHFRQERALVKQNDLWGYIDSTGNWIVPPTFQQAEQFIDSKAYVYVNGKTGIIGWDGKYLVEPIYDQVTQGYYGIETVIGDKKGFISTDWEQAIPTEYEKIDFSNGYVSAKRSYGDYDLYYNGQLLQKGLKNTIGYGDVVADGMHIIVSKNEKKGVIDQSGNWIIEPVYSDIKYLYLGENPYTPFGELPAMYQLDQTEYQYFDELQDAFEQLGPTELYLAKITGQLINTEAFSAITFKQNYQGLDHIEVMINGKLAYLEPDLTIRKTAYIKIADYFNWKVCYDGELAHLFKNGKEIAAFEDIIIPESGYEIYNEYGEPTGEYTEQYYLPYLMVKKQQDELALWSVFDLEENKRLDEWSEEQRTVTVAMMDDVTPIFFIQDAKNWLYSYYYLGMKQPTDYRYTGMYLMSSNYLVAQLADESILFEVTPNKAPTEILHTFSIDMSLNKYVIDWENPIGDEYSGIPQFSESFVLHRNMEGKQGIVANNGVVVPAIYDTLIQHETIAAILHTQLNGKWGSIDVRNGNSIRPYSDQPLQLTEDFYLEEIVAVAEDQGCYFNSKGRKMYNLGPEYEEFKVQGHVGYKVYPDFPLNDNEEMVIAIPALYKSIEATNHPNRFIVKNDQGKLGVIDCTNDTIVAFDYSSIKEMPIQLEDNVFLYETGIGKKKGLLSLNSGKYIPALYESYQLIELGYAPIGFQVKSVGKTGFYSMDLTEILACKYQSFYHFVSIDELTELRVQENNQWRSIRYYAPTQAAIAIDLQPAYDFMIEQFGYLKTTNGYDEYDLMSGELVQSDLVEIPLLMPESEFVLFMQNGKIGAMNGKKKVVLKPSLTSFVVINSSVLFSVLNGESVYYDLDLKKQFKTYEW